MHRLNGKSLTLHEQIVDHFSRHGFPNADRWVTRALKAGELALYFDGLDEVATEQRPTRADRLKTPKRYWTRSWSAAGCCSPSTTASVTSSPT